MTKDQFRATAQHMINAIVSLPDDVWGVGFPAISIRVGDELISLSLTVLGEEDDDEDGDDR